MKVVGRTPDMNFIPMVEDLTEKTINYLLEVTPKVRVVALEAHVLQGDCLATYLNESLEKDS